MHTPFKTHRVSQQNRFGTVPNGNVAIKHDDALADGIRYAEPALRP